MNRILSVLVLTLLSFTTNAADVAISGLPAGTTLAGTEAIPAVQSGATVKTTPAQISTYIESNLTNTDVVGKFTGTCTATQFLRGDGSCNQVTLTTNVTGTLPVANGGTGVATLANDSLLMGNAASAMVAKAVPSCSAATSALTYNTSTDTWGCNTISAGATNITASGSLSPVGFTTVITQSFTLTKAGNQVTLRLSQSVSGTSNSVNFTTAAAPIPAAYRPLQVAIFTDIAATDNDIAKQGCIKVTTGGDVNFGIIDANAVCQTGAWTDSGTKGMSIDNGPSYFTWSTN